MKLQFSGPIWPWNGKGSWHFITLPEDLGHEIRFHTSEQKAFGSVAVNVKCRKSEWKTSLFKDRKSGSYLLPVKASVRDSEGLHAGDMLDVEISLLKPL